MSVNDILHYLKLLVYTVAASILYFGSRALLGYKQGIIELLFDKSKTPLQRWRNFLITTLTGFLLLVVLSIVFGKR